MADLFTVTAPLMIRRPDGATIVIAERFRHPRGLLYFEPFWHLGDPDAGIHLAAGAIAGDGPWKVGDHVVQILVCHGTDFCAASTFQDWRQYLAENHDAYPPEPLIAAIARRHGVVDAVATLR